MIAGSLGQLETPTDEPLESWFNGHRFPALEVENTQQSFDDRPIQSGTAAGTVATTYEDIMVAEDTQGNPATIAIERTEDRDAVATEWVADVTETGLIVPESVEGDGRLDFPFDLFYERCGSMVERLRVDVGEVHTDWNRKDTLGDVWMSGQDPGDGASIEYHGQADPEETPTIGLGFERPWNGTVQRGVVFESGYVAIYNETRPTAFIRFLDEELLEYAYAPGEDDEQQQATLGDAGGGDDFADEVEDHLEGEGYDVERGDGDGR